MIELSNYMLPTEIHTYIDILITTEHTYQNMSTYGKKSLNSFDI